VTIQLIPSLPIIDPFDHQTDSQVILRHLAFTTTSINGPDPSSTNLASLRLVASFSRREEEEAGFVEQVQSWDVRLEHSSLSTGFLGLESFNDLRNSTGAPSSPDEILRGPEEWVFNRVAHRKLVPEELSSSSEPAVQRSSSIVRVCNLFPEWRARTGCFLLFIEKEKKASIGIPEPDNHPGAITVDDNHERQMIECWVLDAHDLSTIAVKPLPKMSAKEAQQACLSYHGVLCCSLDARGEVRASPLISSDQSPTVVGLIVSAIHNREPVDDISRLLGTTFTPNTTLPLTTDGLQNGGDGAGFDCQMIFHQVSSVIGPLSTASWNFDFDPCLPASWSVGYNLWSTIPGYQNAADLALICRQLFAALGVVTMAKAENYARSVWHMIGLSRWYSRLCQKIVGSIDPESETPHLCLLVTRSCSFYLLYKIAMFVTPFSNSLKAACSTTTGHQRRPSQPIHPSSNALPENYFYGQPGGILPVSDPQVEIARVVFAEIWEHQNLIHMESWGRMLQELGKVMYPKRCMDFSTYPSRQVHVFMLPLAATDPTQVAESVRELGEYIHRHPTVIKPTSTASSGQPSPVLDSTTPPAAPSTGPSPTHMATSPSAPSMTTGRATNEGGEGSGKSQIAATLKRINRAVKADEYHATYDVLTGVKISETLASAQRSRAKQDVDGLDGLVKECVTCRARTLVQPWTSNDLLSATSSSSTALASSDPPLLERHQKFHIYLSRLGQFDLSIREYKQRCVCAGLWRSLPSSS